MSTTPTTYFSYNATQPAAGQPEQPHSDPGLVIMEVVVVIAVIIVLVLIAKAISRMCHGRHSADHHHHHHNFKGLVDLCCARCLDGDIEAPAPAPPASSSSSSSRVPPEKRPPEQPPPLASTSQPTPPPPAATPPAHATSSPAATLPSEPPQQATSAATQADASPPPHPHPHAHPSLPLHPLSSTYTCGPMYSGGPKICNIYYPPVHPLPLVYYSPCQCHECCGNWG